VKIIGLFTISLLQKSSTNSPPKKSLICTTWIDISLLFVCLCWIHPRSKNSPPYRQFEGLDQINLPNATGPNFEALQMEAQYNGTKLQSAVLWILCVHHPEILF
jgi:hypothetical protein